MQDIGIGDIIGILIAFGIIHGIMYWVGERRKASRGRSAEEEPKQTG